MVLVAPNAVFGGIGKIDKREYVDWNTEPYNNYVRICSENGCGTGEFVSYRYILTNKHVAECCGIAGDSECMVYTSDGKGVAAKVVATGGGISQCKFDNGKDLETGLDWSIIEILNKDFIKQRIVDNKTGFDSFLTYNGNNLKRAGFGALKVLNDDDIKNIKTAYEIWFKEKYPEFTMQNIDLERDQKYVKSKPDFYKTFLDKFKEITGKDFVYEYLFDSTKLKAINDCVITKTTNKSFSHTCDGWHGDSGSAILDPLNRIIGLDNCGYSYVGTTQVSNYGVPVTEEMKKTLFFYISKDNKTEEPVSPDVPENPNPVPVPPVLPGNRDVGLDCLKSDLPPHAVSGHYIQSGSKKLACNNGGHCSCAATVCESGYYLVVNAKGWSQGWCYTRRCPSGQHLNIIDKTKTDTKCVDD